MDRMHLMTVFIAVGENQSFAAASRKLSLSPAAVTRAIVSLETQLGVKLLARTTRSVRLTDAGVGYLSDARDIMARIAEADEAASGINASPQGHLAVTAPVLFGKLYVMPAVVDYLQRHPAVDVSAYFLDRSVNLVEEGMDVAVRIGHLPDSSLKALRVGTVRRVLCASPAYLAQRGVPQAPPDLQHHTIIAASSISPRVEWKFGPPPGSAAMRMQPRLTVTSNDAAIEAVARGLGIARLLSYQVAAQVAAGQLCVVLADFEEEPWPVHILHRESRYGSAKVRSFIDLLAARLRADAGLNPPA